MVKIVFFEGFDFNSRDVFSGRGIRDPNHLVFEVGPSMNDLVSLFGNCVQLRETLFNFGAFAFACFCYAQQSSNPIGKISESHSSKYNSSLRIVSTKKSSG